MKKCLAFLVVMVHRAALTWINLVSLCLQAVSLLAFYMVVLWKHRRENVLDYRKTGPNGLVNRIVDSAQSLLVWCNQTQTGR